MPKQDNKMKDEINENHSVVVLKRTKCVLYKCKAVVLKRTINIPCGANYHGPSFEITFMQVFSTCSTKRAHCSLLTALLAAITACCNSTIRHSCMLCCSLGSPRTSASCLLLNSCFTSALILLHTFSIGLRIGEYGAKRSSLPP